MGWKRGFVKWGLLGQLSSFARTQELFSACPTSCRTCDDLGSCLSCEPGSVLQNYECVEQCSDGLFERDGECHFCPINCDTCNSEHVSAPFIFSLRISRS